MEHSIFYSEPKFIELPNNITCVVYHMNPISEDTKVSIMEFIKTHDCTDSGNITELSVETSKRLLSTSAFLGILYNNTNIIGTIITCMFRAKYKEHKLLTSYTTFLCIHKDYRKQGLAGILINRIMRKAYNDYNMQHGYYLCAQPHRNVFNEIKSWYRPINISKAITSGFTLETFKDDKKGTKQRIKYHISKPSILPVKAEYNLAINIFGKGDLCLDPSEREFIELSKCFDIYTVGTSGLFMLFPMTTYITSSKKRVTNAQVSLVIGDVLPHVLYIAQNLKYDLLYGWCVGDVTEDTVNNISGLITTSTTYLEYYNTKYNIPNDKLYVPIF